MKTRILTALIACAICAAPGNSVAQAEPDPVSFQFTFCSEDDATTATGFITFDANAMSNPFDSIDYAFVLDLQVTVAGATAGNGTFIRDDFSSIAWNSNGAVLDLGTELVGQPTSDLAWGTEGSFGQAGDFNLFDSGNTAGAPNGVFYFLLGANEGSGETMTLRTFAPGEASIGEPLCPAAPRIIAEGIPSTSWWSGTLLILLLGGAAAAGLRQRAHS